MIHHTWLGRTLANIFGGGLKAVAHTAVAITEEIKTLFAGGLIQGLAAFLDATLKTSIAVPVVTALNLAIPHVLAVELAIEGLPDNPAEADILKFENDVFTAVTGLSPLGTSKLYTTLSAEIYGIIKPQVDAHIPLTFAVIVKDVEEAYQDYLQYKIDNP